MPVLYLTFDSEISLEPADENTKKFTGKLDTSSWTIANFLLEKNELKIYHNEFFKGSHQVIGIKNKKYVIDGIVKMTVKPKIAELLLSGNTNWALTKVSVTHDMDDENSVELAYLPAKSGGLLKVSSTLDKPSK